ncbi:DNA gyrase subunit A [Criibacterium bergeronii]|uniref:DNA gyrase subunit A n=1 Tax=Criibacterium bergeronii TaxID=1871336 RepID=A0A371IM20_9FIRM|nr:DNA gyrase subunit A [Criibacterium bergeronii]MBS6063438.1 DNA gyrase subunit A [Peptostreptococcaceae bacterium]RDY21553.1 DNA gyrase subunit A [Criibacterium bergeronii]TRW24207.1 DNA gyrase subunit A [Criibacterium bergeronii]
MSEDIKDIHGKIKEVDLNQQMKRCYIDYSMSVIIGRALPDIRDGLKPVHRRILYAMAELGLTADKPFHKSANVVGHTMAYYHPHGDSSIYDAMVRLAQSFSMRYPLVEGKGNFGTLDGDPPAAYRYTEARMDKMAQYMLQDLNKNTVDFRPNFDEKKQEPVVLPSRFPNLLVNGANGIAVGMATSIPPHNLKEVVDALIALIDNPDATLDDLMQHIKGPDFPTGGVIMGKENIKHAYETGRGKVVLRAKTKIEELPNGKSEIIVTEIPYQLNKAMLVEKIGQLVRDKKIEGITDLRDESSKKTGIKIVIETRRDINPTVLLNQLFKHSQLQTVFSIILLSIVDGEPKVLGLKSILNYYLNFQKEVVTRRTQFDLTKAEERLHIVEGLLIAIDYIDEVIRIIRTAYDDALQKLMDRFNLSEIQATAILDMRLRRLQGLEKEKLEDEKNELIAKIKEYNEILSSEEKLLSIIKQELTEISDKYNDKRKTQIIAKEKEIDILDTIPNEEVAITLTHQGYIKRAPIDTFKSQKRGGKGIACMTTKEEDFVENFVITKNHEMLLFLTAKGKIYNLDVYKVPQVSRTAKGTNIVNLIPLEKDDKVTSFISTDAATEENYLTMFTRKGIIKKTKVTEYTKSKIQGKIAINLDDGDGLVNVILTPKNIEFLLVTKNGLAIQIAENTVRPLGRATRGVTAMKLKNDDEVISVDVTAQGSDLLVISENGYGKRTELSNFKVQNRGGVGIIAYKVTVKSGKVAGAVIVNPQDEIMIINSDGTLIRTCVQDISLLGRSTSGVKLMRVEGNSSISSIAKIAAEDVD